MNTPRGVWLDDLTRQEAVSRCQAGAPAIVPVVAWGEGVEATHLPFRTAPTIARALAQKLVERLDVIMTPIVDADGLSHATLGEILRERRDGLHALGARRLALLDAFLAPAALPGVVPSGMMVVRAFPMFDSVTLVTSGLLALDPRGVRMALLPVGSQEGAQAGAFAGERAMAAATDAAITALVGKWPDLA